MASVLSSTANSPLGFTSLGHDTSRRSCSSIASVESGGTVQHHRLQSISTDSLSSVGSCLRPNHLEKKRSQLNQTFIVSRRSSRASPCFPSSPPEQREKKLADVVEGQDGALMSAASAASLSGLKALQPVALNESIADPLNPSLSSSHSSPIIGRSNSRPFYRWLSVIRDKRRSQPQPIMQRGERWSLNDFDQSLSSVETQHRRGHNKSDSQGSSSLAFVTAVKSATATLTSTSIATVSRRASKWRHGQQRSILLSGSDPRPSFDSQRSVSDEAAKERARKRRAKLEELIRTEESYVGDLKALSNTYFTILSNGPTSASFARRSAQRTIAEMLHLHDDILGHLHRAVPFAEYDQSTARVPPAVRTHNRWHSIDVVPIRPTPPRTVLSTIRQGRRSLNISRSTEDEPPLMHCSPQTVAEVTHVFAYNMSRFSAYTDYGANYDLVRQDIEEIQQAIAGWAEFDKAIEAISAHVNPTRSREANRRRATTVKDLLIKPIQRIPRYELLFSDLSILTPACDDPTSHAEIEELRTVLNEKAVSMNEAKKSPTHTRTMETTWLIGARLTFSTSQVPKSIFLQLLGPVSLCGCLHIAYRSREHRIKGFYVISILFGSSILLASADEDSLRYSVLAGIALANTTIEETDNNKGLQCHTAPHSWKIVFEQGARMYELIMTACSAVEADAWRTYIASGIELQTQLVVENKLHPLPLASSLTLDMKSVGKAFGKPSSFVKRMPVRAATIGPSADLSQVIITNTQAVKETQEYKSSQTSLQIPRSQSMATPSHVHTLAPRRCDRHRLEAILADVWTKEQIPYPGMARRIDPIRASANHVIRKFSMASITSNFSSSKRTASYASVSSRRREAFVPSRSRASGRDTSSSISSRHSKPRVVNFHIAPDAFLPADFEVPGGAPPKKKRSALRTFTMTMERPFSPLMGSENVQSGVRRAESVRGRVVDAFSQARPSWSPASALTREDGGRGRPVYSVGRDPAAEGKEEKRGIGSEETVFGVVRKSKSRLLGRLFG